MTSIEVLDSSAALDDVEHHFCVTAGPGSGKTHWLIGHVRRVAQLSKRLTPCSRIAVISYTNVAVREIQRRLETAADVAEVSTIHSFLYRHVVRPYLHLLKDEDGNDLVSHHLVDTHSEHFVARDVLDAWLGEYRRRQLLMQPNNLELLKSRLRSIAIRIDEQEEPFLVPCKTEARDKHILNMLTPERLLDYKIRYWQRGHIDHEDVLYFAYRLFGEMPSLREFLSARFPYLLIDEFQDTLPVQAAVVRWLADCGTIVGVIGDREQAIYGFLDASPTHFADFQLPGFKTYAIEGNRRSTGAIVTFLNGVRNDGLQQQPVETESGIPPTVYFGSLNECLAQSPAFATRLRESRCSRPRVSSNPLMGGVVVSLSVGPVEKVRLLLAASIASPDMFGNLAPGVGDSERICLDSGTFPRRDDQQTTSQASNATTRRFRFWAVALR